jgi:hypothetical protein
MIAELWRNDREDNVRYFWNNVQSGIRTFEGTQFRRRCPNSVQALGIAPQGNQTA